MNSYDFSTLFRTLRADPRSYERDRNVFSIAVGRSIFDQVLPPNSVALGWSTFAAHWLSATPAAVDPSGHLSITMATEEARVPWAALAAEDWRRFIQSRAAELRPGGRMLVEVAACDTNGQHGVEPLYRVADRALADMVEDGELDPAAARRLVVPVYARSESELRTPFDESLVEGCVDLEAFEMRIVRDPFLDQWRRSGDASAYATEWTQTFRAFTKEVLFGQFANADALAAAFYRRMHRSIAEDPLAINSAWAVADLVVRRR